MMQRNLPHIYLGLSKVWVTIFYGKVEKVIRSFTISEFEVKDHQRRTPIRTK
jgi:hypothetical protein